MSDDHGQGSGGAGGGQGDGGQGGGGGQGGMPDLGSLMNMAQKLQGDVVKMQEELAKMECDGSAGGGMVTATVNGHYELVKIAIEKEVVDPAEIEMLQDLIVAAVNQAMVKMRDEAKTKMSSLTGGLGLNIPGLG